MVATVIHPNFSMDELDDVTIDHIVCCEDPDVAFCGADVSEASWGCGPDAIACLKCFQVNQRHAQCPYGKECPE